MADEEDVVVRRERRIARRDRTRSPGNRYGDEGGAEEGMADTSSRRKNSALNFSASKLVENLKESNETTITRLRRVASTDGMARAAAEARAGRRPISRTLSAQGVRRPERRLRAAEHDVLSHSLGDNLGDPSSGHNMMDDSNQMSGSQSDRRRRAPMRTRSSDSGLRAGSQRTPRGGRRRPPQHQEREEAGDDGGMNDNSRRRPPPGRSKSSQDAFAPRGPARPSRPGRRRPQAPGETAAEEEDVIISDSDEEDHQDNNNIDRSSRRQRGGLPPRTRSSDGGLARGAQRTARAMRRRGSGDNAETSPPKRSSGPGFQRSLTSTPASGGGGSGSGPGLMRSHTSTNPRGARSRGSRNTAKEIARVSRERSPDIDEVFNDVGDPMAAAESVRQISSAHQSNSPVKSRQERRRLREDKEREALERRTQQQQQQQVQVEKEVLVEPEIKKEEPWMRRLKKTVGDRAPEDSSFNLDGATSTHTEGSKGSPFPNFGDHTAFAADPTFGVFPAASDMVRTTSEGDDDDATAHLSITGGGKYSGKLDFSTIS